MSPRTGSAVSFFSILPDIEVEFPPPNQMGLVLARSSVVTRAAYMTRLLGRETRVNGLNAMGKGFTSGQAISSLVGETAERLALFEPDLAGRESFSLEHLAEGSREYVSPFDLVRDHRAILNPRFLLSPDRETLSNRTKFAFVSGRHLVSGEDVLVPAGDVYLCGRGSLEKQEILDYRSTTNGAASHTTPEAASVRALFELLERHDMLRSWLCRDAGLRLRDVTKFETLAADIYVGRANTLTSDFSDYSTAIAIYISEAEPRFHIAAAADLDHDRATVRALAEVLQGTRFMSPVWNHPRRRDQLLAQVEATIFTPGRTDYYDSLPLGWNSFYYSTDAGFDRIQPELDRLFDMTRASRRLSSTQIKPYVMEVMRRPTPEPSEELTRLRSIFAGTSVDPIVVDVTGRFAGMGMSIQKAFSLDLLPLPLQAPPPLQHPSLAECASLNPLPHPFV
jgi:ribosomal protein S12 methylthiotransferase accessory factor YcaO